MCGTLPKLIFLMLVVLEFMVPVPVPVVVVDLLDSRAEQAGMTVLNVKVLNTFVDTFPAVVF